MSLSLRSDVESLDPSLVPLWVSETFIGQYFQVATLTMLIYDNVTTMDKEVRYFWKAPLKTVNIIYFATRYIGLLGAIASLYWNVYGVNLRQCNFSGWTWDVSNWSTYLLIDYILMIRVLALYSRDKKLTLCLGTLLMIEAAVTLGILIYSVLISDVAVISLARDVTVCAENEGPLGWEVVEWVIPGVYGLLLMAFATYKAAEFWKISAGFKGFTLVKVLFQDQLIYFAIALSCFVFEMLVLRLQGSNEILSFILNLFTSTSFLSVLGSRLLVNLKEAGEQGLNEGTSYRMRSTSLSEMEFS